MCEVSFSALPLRHVLHDDEQKRPPLHIDAPDEDIHVTDLTRCQSVPPRKYASPFGGLADEVGPAVGGIRFVDFLDAHADEIVPLVAIERTGGGVWLDDHARLHVDQYLHRTVTLKELPIEELALLKRCLRPHPLCGVTEAPNAPGDSLWAEQRTRVLLEHAVVFEANDIDVFRIGAVKIADPREERFRISELFEDERDQFAVVACVDQRRWDVP